MIVYRLARPGDVDELAANASEFFEGFAPGHCRPDAELVRSYLAGIVAGGSIVLACDGPAIVGAIGLTRARPEWSRDWYLCERGMWVRADHRASGIFRSMIGVCEAIVARTGLPLEISHRSGDDARRLAAFFGRRPGWRLLGASFRYRPSA